MLAQCPNCATLFEVSDTELRQADGWVRCGRCRSPFDAYRQRAEAAPAAQPGLHEFTAEVPTDAPWFAAADPEWELEAEMEVSVEPGLDTEPRSVAEPASDLDPDRSDAAESTGLPPGSAAAPAALDAAPGSPDGGDIPAQAEAAQPAAHAELDRLLDEVAAALPDALADDARQAVRPRRSLLARVLMAWLVILLLIAAVAQYAWFMPADALARFPGLRAQLTPLLAQFGRLPPPRRAPDLISLVNREVSAHPAFDGALIVSASLRNDAAFAQPYPQLRLTLFDVNGHVIAQRDFLPRQYLQAPPREGALLASGADAAIGLELASPETQAVSYEFTFL